MGRRTTNMDEIRRIAKSFLMMDPVETEFSPLVIIHPFTNSGIVPVPVGKSYKLLDISKDKDGFREWQKNMSEYLDGLTSPLMILTMMNKSYGIVFLHYTKDYLSEKDYSEMLCSAWLRAENPNRDINVTQSELLNMFSCTRPEYLMDEEELEQLAEIDSPVTVYRGVTSYNADNVRAMSWSLSYDTAEWFSRRFGEDGVVYEAQIPKEHIFALFNGRNESEVIVDPKYLMNIQEVAESMTDNTMIGGIS